MAYISFRNITSTSFEAKVYDLATAGSYGHYVEWLLDGEHWSSENLADDATSSGWMTFDGLKPDMDYSVEAHNLTNEGAVIETVGKICHTETASAANEWYISKTDTWSDVTSTTNKEYHIPEYGVVRIKFWFATSGTARFYSSGASGGYAAISDSTKFKPENGAPVTALAEGESKRGDFEFTYNVEAQTTYYLFVSNYRETDSGYIDVYIEPPGGSSGGWMIAHETNYSSISSTKSNDYDLLAGEVAKIRVSFSRSGTAQFYAEGSIDNIAFLSDQSSEYFDTSSGQPGNIRVQDDDSGADSNFSFTYDVVAGTYYYLYVRNYNISTSGLSTVFIVPPAVEDTWTVISTGTFTNIDTKQSVTQTLDAGYVGCVEFSCLNSGTVTLSSDSSVDTIGYLASSASFDAINGTPNNQLTQDDDSGGNNNFSITYEVTAGKTYYLFFRCYNISNSGSVTVYIDPPAGVAPADGAYIEFGSNTGTTITVSVKGLDTAYGRDDRYIYWSIDSIEKNPVSLSSRVSQSNPYTFTGLSPSTSYTIGARITYTSNGSTLSKKLTDISCTTANWASEQQSGLGTVSTTKTASWTLHRATISYASVRFSQSGNVTISSSGSYDTYGYLTKGTPSFNNSTGVPDNYVASDDDSGDSRNFSITYAVESGVTYYIWARGLSTTTTVGNITINVEFSNRPELFTWNDGSTVKTSGQNFDITASEWCALLDNINAVRQYKGFSPISTGSGVAYFTYPSRGDVFTATHYNQALNGITGMLGTGYDANAVVSGEAVTAAKINFLVEEINNIT